jgi:hypothetical protein
MHNLAIGVRSARLSVPQALRGLAGAAALLLASAAVPASAQFGGQYAIAPSGNPVWADQSAYAASLAPILPFFGGAQTPATIPVYQTVLDFAGATATYQPGGATATATNAFFQSLGINGRTCASCHSFSAGWSITPSQIQALFYRTGGTDPLFQPVDGANCSTADVSSLPAQLSAYSLLLNKGLIRIFEKVAAPPDLQYSIVAITDPYNCSTNPATGLTSYGPNGTTAGILSVYRRPLPSTNLDVLSTILFDGRETTLQQQAIDANRIHAQATTPPTATQLAQMVSFESGLYSAQTDNFLVGSLTTKGASGGPVAFSQQPFYLGINDPFGGNPNNVAFTPDVYTLYTAWAPTGTGGFYGGGYGFTGQARAAIAQGEQIFNERHFTISGVTGLNDVLGQPTITGTCSTCHDAPNAGSHSLNLLMDTGLVVTSATGLDTSGLPVFTLQCNAGPLAGQSFTVTDPGRAILSGQCADIGRLKVPTLRNLAVRPPYFHNGSAATLGNVVQFYNGRFGIGLSAQDQANLAAFLNSL